MQRTVTFRVSTGYVGSEREEEITLQELGLDDLEGEELNAALEDAYKVWLWENIDTSWDLEDWWANMTTFNTGCLLT